eukprot:7383810-Prymnesium_polylepis.1
MEQWLMSPQEASDLTYVESEAVKTSVKVFEEAISNEVLDSMPVAQANMLRVTYTNYNEARERLAAGANSLVRYFEEKMEETKREHAEWLREVQRKKAMRAGEERERKRKAGLAIEDVSAAPEVGDFEVVEIRKRILEERKGAERMDELPPA